MSLLDDLRKRLAAAHGLTPDYDRYLLRESQKRIGILEAEVARLKEEKDYAYENVKAANASRADVIAENIRLKALADCAGELDADNVKTYSVDGWLRVRSYVVSQIQEAWLEWKKATEKSR